VTTGSEIKPVISRVEGGSRDYKQWIRFCTFTRTCIGAVAHCTF